MKWTPEAVAELKELAHLGAAGLGEHFGISKGAAMSQAVRLRIHLGSRAAPRSPEQALRRRWESYLPGMKAALVADILRD